ncbi:hypothetical protein QY95_01292 [Bacillus thermotolerans]|uniref:Uncharacterized protein n=1 Tax=Bacillus thermotolerans TaxID=1221996 RepID=A0A0F5I5I2_BACTR|nr:hypothetical protein QY95_01292 [Bacillus thermotolerans]
MALFSSTRSNSALFTEGGAAYRSFILFQGSSHHVTIANMKHSEVLPWQKKFSY